MNKSDAKQLALQLMREHCLRPNLHKGGRDWKFKFDNAKKRFGICRYSCRTISLSSELVLLNSVDEVRDTILHEIAHALVGPNHHHDSVWKDKAKEIGARTDSSKWDNVKRVPGKLQLVCETCGDTVYYHRKVLLPRACGGCCKKYNGGKYSSQYELKEVAMKTKPVFIKSKSPRKNTGKLR